MTTLAIMKARIASDLRRDDLTDDIADYISEAIEDFQQERFWFNESRSFTFNTVVNTQRYTSVEFPDVVNIIKVDSAYATFGDARYQITPKDPNWIQRMTTNTGSAGQTQNYALYAVAFWLYPVPNDVWTIDFMGVAKYAAPAADATTGNYWMTDARRMIRSQALGHLYAYVIKDRDKASGFYQLAEDAKGRLKDRTAEMLKTGDYLVEAWDPF